MNRLNLADEVVVWIRSNRPESKPLIASGEGKLTCPSYPDNSHGTKFALRLKDNSFHFLGSEDDFAGLVEVQSVRFCGPCLTSRCAYWLGNCQLGVKISYVALDQESGRSSIDVMSDCPIQKTCRWKVENGLVACQSCVEVSYEVRYG